MRQIVLIAHNVRSCHNVGSLLRTADGLGIEKIYLTGYTPYPKSKNDSRLPHLAAKIDKQISKTALGAQISVAWSHAVDIDKVVDNLKSSGYRVVALEQAKNSTKLPDFQPPDKLAIIVGREVEGIEPEILNKADTILEIPMFGQKESFNVAAATAMALYHCQLSLKP
jgi:tRNA G18 (ribose-2'-O)-methylase SpoU